MDVVDVRMVDLGVSYHGRQHWVWIMPITGERLSLGRPVSALGERVAALGGAGQVLEPALDVHRRNTTTWFFIEASWVSLIKS
jgi:hypothetical protein